MVSLLRQEAYIGGRWVGGSASIAVDNPATGAVIGHVPDLGEAETLDAVAAAEAALPAWRARTAKDRGQVLRRWAELMMANQAELARLMTLEQGKPLKESEGEIAYAASFFEWFAEEGRRAYGETIPGHAPDRRLFTLKRPVGVVAAITPWNFPAAMITRKVGPALAAGCTVVLKPSELTPFSALALAVLGEAAGVPPGVFNIVTGAPAPIGAVLTGDPRIRKFTFTGSTAVGKRLGARCMETVKRVSLELGGNAPFLIFADADLDAAVEGLIASKFRNTGQTCVCANRIYVEASVHEEVAERLAVRVAAFKVGDGLAGPTDQGPLINAAGLAKVETHVADALAGGARLLTGGQGHAAGAAFYAPTVLAGVRHGALLTREETFGPVAGLVPFEAEDAAIVMANDTPAGLAAYAYTRDLSRAWRLAEGLEYGMVGLNTGLISTEVSPFGGVKESGLGREGARAGLEEYLDTRAVCLAI